MQSCPGGDLLAGGIFTASGNRVTGYFARFGCACYANCDGSTQPPALHVLDFTCFLNAFAAECP